MGSSGFCGRWWQGAGLAVFFLCRSSAAEERIDCVLDSECTRGRCIDLICVDADGTPVAPAAAPSGSAPGTLRPPPSPPESAPAAQGTSVVTPPAEPSPRVETTSKERHAPKRRVAEPGPEAAGVPAPMPAPALATGTAPAPSAPVEPVRRRKSYWAPLLAAYAVPPIGLAAAVSADSPGLAVVAAFAPPIVHWANGQGGKGVLALFLAPLAAGVGALIGRSACGGRSDCSTPMYVGAFLGYSGWAAFDVGVMAYRKLPAGEAAFGVGPLPSTFGRGLEVRGVF